MTSAPNSIHPAISSAPPASSPQRVPYSAAASGAAIKDMLKTIMEAPKPAAAVPSVPSSVSASGVPHAARSAEFSPYARHSLAPSAQRLDIQSAPAGSRVTIHGSRFPEHPAQSRVRLLQHGVTAGTGKVLRVTPHALTFQIPDDISTGTYDVLAENIEAYMAQSNTLQLAVTKQMPGRLDAAVAPEVSGPPAAVSPVAFASAAGPARPKEKLPSRVVSVPFQPTADGQKALSSASVNADEERSKKQITELRKHVEQLHDRLEESQSSSVKSAIELARLQEENIQLRLQLSELKRPQVPRPGAARHLDHPKSQPEPNREKPHVLQKGDTLWALAKKYYGEGKLWRKILEANTAKIKNPQLLKPGTVIAIPEIKH